MPNAKFQYNVKCVRGGWIDRCVLLQTDTMTPLETRDPSAGLLPLVFENATDAERFRNGLAENAAEILQQSSGMTFDQALAFVKKESTDALAVAMPANGTMTPEQDVYLVSF